MATHETKTGTRAKYRLLIYRDASVRTIVLEGDRWVVGRAEDCEIQLNDPTASRHHLVLELQNGEISFRDLGGTNVTLLNGRPLREGPIAVGATLLVGMTRLTLDSTRAQAKVRVIDNPRQTAVIFRQYLESPEEGEGTDTKTSFLEARKDPVTNLLDELAELAELEPESDNIEDAANQMLEVALTHMGRDAGLIGTLDPMGPLKVLTSIHHGPAGSELEIPIEVMQELRARPKPLILESQNGLPPERIFVPVGREPQALLMLEGPRLGAPQGQMALRMAHAFARYIWTSLQDKQEKSNLRQELARLRFSRGTASTQVLSSARLQGMRQKLADAARHDLPVVLAGEEGTEKEELAHYLHSQSQKAAGPFIVLYSRALPEHRIEEELIGIHRGTDQVQQSGSTSCLLRAHGGTLFIDQPDALPAAIQDRLVKILTRKTIEIPGQELSIPLDVRLVVAATDFTEASEEMTQGMRNYLNSIRLNIPPLRTHPNDIATFAELILSEMGPSADGCPRTMTDGAKRQLLLFGWPGNGRQLRRALETAAARAKRQPIAPRHLPPEVREIDEPAETELPTIAELERRHIVLVLSAVNGNKRQAATILGIATSTLYQKIGRYEIDA